MKHWTEVSCQEDMSPYAPWYQSVLEAVTHWKREGLLFVELGVRAGCSARIILDHMKDIPGAELYLIDAHYNEEVEELRTVPCVHYSVLTAEYEVIFFRDGRIDFLHIDLDHDYEQTKRVFELYEPKLMTDAMVIFHDCTPAFPGVYQYVNELNQRGWFVEYAAPQEWAGGSTAPAVVYRSHP